MMNDCIHDFSSLEPFCPTTPEELKKNEQETNEIQSNASVAYIWKEVTIGGVSSPLEMNQILVRSGISVIGLANRLLEKVNFSGRLRSVRLAVVSGTDIGFHENRPYSYKEWRDQFLKKGFRLVPAEAFLCARVSSPELESGKNYLAMMEPICLSDGANDEKLLFVMWNWSGSKELFTVCGEDDYGWYPEHRFIVEIP